MIVYYMIAGGLVLLFVGGELLVRGAVTTAQHLHVSPLLIGITVVGFGTSTPELVASIQGALLDSPGIALGNVVGSNIINILLMLGLAALLAPITFERKGLVRDVIGLLVSMTALCTVALTGGVTREASYVLIAMLALYMIIAYFTERKAPSERLSSKAPPLPLLASIILLVFGLAAMIGGARILVENSIVLARHFGLSESLIGLTIVALGTSLPELVATLVAVARHQSSIAFGNIIGSNIYNVFSVLGFTGLVRPMSVPADIVHSDLWVMVGATLALAFFSITDTRLTRGEGLALLLGYVVYVGSLYVRIVGLV